jgi:hypothetical protein
MFFLNIFKVMIKGRAPAMRQGTNFLRLKSEINAKINMMRKGRGK